MKTFAITIISAVLIFTACSHTDTHSAEVERGIGQARELADSQLALRRAQALYGSESPQARAADSAICAINDSISHASAAQREAFRKEYELRQASLLPQLEQIPAPAQSRTSSADTSLMLDADIPINP